MTETPYLANARTRRALYQGRYSRYKWLWRSQRARMAKRIPCTLPTQMIECKPGMVDDFLFEEGFDYGR